MAYEVTIGIEIHCELDTKTKMFSSSSVSHDAPVNTCVNEVDLALPGTLPTVNKMAVEYALRLSHALNMKIESLVQFDRKNYFYSDLPKGYQITQQFNPIGEEGELIIHVNQEAKRIGITRLHMEEDTAKQIHENDKTLIDFNRAGVPLLEIVSEPELKSAQEAAAYVSELQRLIKYVGISEARMEDGQLRCDVNISLAPEGSDLLGTKVEIKNLNSINNVQKAIEKEIVRQSALLDNNEEIVQATMRFDEDLQETVLMRKKEGTVDYKYFREPNLYPIQLESEWIHEIKENLVELPHARLERYTKELGLEFVNANILVANKELSDFYDHLLDDELNPIQSANYVITEVVANMPKDKVNFSEVFDVTEIKKLLQLIQDKTLSSKQAKMVLPELVNKKKSVDKVVREKGLKQISDSATIQKWIDEILENNPQVILDYAAGKDNSVKFVMGQVMKLSRGQANPAMANKMAVETLLSKTSK